MGRHSYSTYQKNGSTNVIGADLEEAREYFKHHNRVREFSGHGAKIHSVDWSCDGRRLASGSFDKCVVLYSLDKDKLVKELTFKGHNDSVDQLCWHATNPDLLSTASGDKSVKIWDARHQKSVSTFSTKGENINISWSPDGKYIGVGNKEDLITFIDIRAGKIFKEESFKYEVNEITWNAASNLFFLTNGLGCVCIFNFPEFTLEHTIQAHPGNCICIEFHPLEDYFAVGSADALVSLWDSKELACVRTFTRLDWPVRAISFNHNGTLLASASEDLNIDIAHVETGEKVADVAVESPTFTVAWHPTKNLLAYACDDKISHSNNRDSGTLKLYGILNIDQ